MLFLRPGASCDRNDMGIEDMGIEAAPACEQLTPDSRQQHMPSIPHDRPKLGH